MEIKNFGKNNPHAEFWWDAADQHYLSLIGANTWNLVPIEEARKSRFLTGFFLFSLKSADGENVDRFKARVVVDGSRLSNTADHSPTLHPEKTRIMFASGVLLGMHMHSIDIKDAYVNSPIDSQNVFMRQPTFYVCPDKPLHVCKLNKSLFGLPNSGYNWYSTFSAYLRENNFIQAKLDACIFHSANFDIYILLYVDDTGILAKTLDLIEAFKVLIGTKFKFRDNGELKQFLGTDFKYDRRARKLFMSTKPKIQELFDAYRPRLPNPTKVPLDQSIYVYRPSPNLKEVSTYQQIIGSIMYISTRTRPDITVYTNILSRFMKNPTVYHLELAFKLIAYLQATIHFEMCYCPIGDGVESHADATFGARECFDGKALNGTVVKFAGMAVIWQSTRQSIVSDENCMAELYAANVGLKAGMARENLLNEGILGYESLKLRIDNRTAKSIAENSVSKHSRHYKPILLNVHDAIRRKEVEIDYVPSGKNVADINTKFVATTLFYEFRTQLNLVNTNVRRSDRK